MNSLKSFKNVRHLREVSEGIPEEVIEARKARIQKSKRELFKEKHGMSKTRYRNLKKAGLDPSLPSDIILYKSKLKEVKKAAYANKKAKHIASVAYKRQNGKAKATKKK